ncbi:AI-2E family transporter [Candidatus Daviesbacteria bacterium]|nr:AI-2E family transporter [Candidatus Daviesbacteria bacterium]
MIKKIDISHRTIIFVTIFLIGLWLLYLIRDLILILFVGLILMSALNPLVNLFARVKIPRSLGIAITYIIIIGIISGMLAIILPPLVEQTTRLVVAMPPVIGQVFNITGIDKSIFQSQLADLSTNLFSITLSIFDNILTLIFLLVLTFYLLLERDNLENRAAILLLGREARMKQLITKIEEKLGAWLRGQMLLSLIIGLVTYIGLLALNIPYALSLAVIAAILEVIPVIGPIIAALPAIVVALTISPILGLGVTAMYFVIQQLENHLIVPQVMKRAVGLNPLVVILAIAIGSRLLGIAGALLAVPIAVVLQIVVTEIIEERKI